MKRKIAIAGCGVIGLTTGIRLLEENFDVKIVSREMPHQATSGKAAAFWFPYHVRDSREILKWSMLSYEKFERLSKDSTSGVNMVPVFKMGNEVTEIERRIRETLPEKRFRPLLIEECRGNFSAGWRIEVPLIETPIYLPFLLKKFLQAGGHIIKKEIQSLDELLEKDTVVINCTGMGSRKLANDDELIPVKGQIALLKAENRNYIILEDISPTYVVYRTDGCICGGTYEMNVSSTQTEEDAIQKILQRCFALEPSLASAKIIDRWAGIRPYRFQIRVERDLQKSVVHNYGHGGSGFTVSWGCAEEVADIIRRAD